MLVMKRPVLACLAVCFLMACEDPVAPEATDILVSVVAWPDPFIGVAGDSLFVTVRAENVSMKPAVVTLGEPVFTSSPSTSSGVGFQVRFLDAEGGARGGSRATWGQREFHFAGGEIKEHTFAFPADPDAVEAYFGVSSGEVWVWPSFGRFEGEPVVLRIAP